MSICYHPWVGIDISPQGEFKPCCKYSNPIANDLTQYQKSDELSDLKRQFLNGDKPRGCNRCWQDEAAGLPSKRLLDWEYVFQQQIPNLDELKVLSFPMGNICNLACRICSSDASSKWYTEANKLKNDFPETKIFGHKKFYKDEKFLGEIKNLSSNLIHVEFPGGEPFLTGVEQNLDFLDHLIEHNSQEVSLHYTTNTTKFPKKEFWDKWRNFKKVDIQLSIDGIEDQFEYNRWPAEWSHSLASIEKFKDHANGNIKLSISHTVSIFTVFYLPEFFEWIERAQLPEPYLGLLSNPNYYSISAFPDPIKDKISSKLADPRFDSIIKYMVGQDNSHLFPTSLKYIEILDGYRSQSFQKTFPELHSLML